MSSYSSSDEEDNLECPLCMEEIDLADKYFKPCVCGYQICRFCWHHIKEDLNGKCPGCRREYTEEMVQFKPVSPEKLAQLKAKRKAKKREKKEQENIAKKHYANVRVIQKNLVYVIGLPSYVANEETIKQYDYFGQYGKITKVVINKKTHSPHQSSVGIYITFSKKEEAERAIEAVDNIIFDGRQVKASYGTTKYCTYYLRGQTCQNPQCMYLHEPGEEIESKEDLINKTQVLTSQISATHSKEIKQAVQPKAIKTTIYREKDETSALPASANWGSRNGKVKQDENEKKAISVSLSDLLTKSNENSKMNNINLSRSKSDSHSPLKTKMDEKMKPVIPTIKSQSTINISSIKDETLNENLNMEKVIKSNSSRDEEYPALSSLLNKKSNQSKEDCTSSNISLLMSPENSHSELDVKIDNNVNIDEELIQKDEIIDKEIIEGNNELELIDNKKLINENIESIPKTELPIPTKEELEIKSEEKSEIENDIKEASKRSELEEISNGYLYDQTLTNSSSPTSESISKDKTSSSDFDLFAELNKNKYIKEGKSKNSNSPPPGFESKIESMNSTSNISNSDIKLKDSYPNITQSISALNLSDDEVIPSNSNHTNEFKYNGPFDPFNEIVLNNLMNVNNIMNNYTKHYSQRFGVNNTLYNNSVNNENSLINESNFMQYQNQLNQKYIEQYYQNINREQIQNNLRAMLPNINISSYSNVNENNLWSNQGLQNNFNENLINNSLTSSLNNNNIYFNNFNNNINLLKQLQMSQIINNMQKAQQIENNLNISNNVNLNNTSDFKSLPFKDSAIMAVKMSNSNINNNSNSSIDNSNNVASNMNSMNLFHSLNIKPNDITNNVGFNLNNIRPMNSFSSLNNLNQINGINGINGMSNLNGINNLNNMNNMNSLRNINQMNGYPDISSMNMNLTSTVIPGVSSMNVSNFKGINELNKEGLGGATTTINSIYGDDKMNFFQKISELNKEEIKNENTINKVSDFWESKIQDTGGGKNEEIDLLADSILEQRFNEAEKKSIDYNKKTEENQDHNENMNINNELLNKDNDLNFLLMENEKKCFNDIPNYKIIENKNNLREVCINNENLDKITEKEGNNDEKLEESKKCNKDEKEDLLKLSNNNNNNNVMKLEKNKVLLSNQKNKSKTKLKQDAYEINIGNKNGGLKELNFDQEKENISSNINNKVSSKNKKKEKKEIGKSESKNETIKSEPLIIKFEAKKVKKEQKNEVEEKEPLIVKFEESNSKKEVITVEPSRKIKKEEKAENKKDENKPIKKMIKDVIKDKNEKVLNKVNMFEILPDVIPVENSFSNSNEKEENEIDLKTIEKTIKDQELNSSSVATQIIGATKKNKKKSKHKKKKTISKESSIEDNIDLINKELDMNEKKLKEAKELNRKENESISQSKKKKKGKKKNNDIELHILNVKDSKAQLMKETQLYRLPLTAIAKKLIPEESGTTLGLKPIFPPDIEIEALCNVIVTKRSKKKKRENMNLPFFNSKIGQLKSELDDEKMAFNYIDDVDENMIIERNENHNNLIENKEIDLLRNHNMEINMISSLKQIKRRNLKNIKNEDCLKERNLIENLKEGFTEEDIEEIKENFNISSKDLIDMKINEELIEKQDLSDLNKQMIEQNNVSENTENQFFVFQALEALINTAEVYANALKKQIEEYESSDDLEESNKNSNNYKRKVKIYEAVLESIKDIREMGLSDYKTLEKVYFSDMKNGESYEDNISNLLISVKYIMQELVLNVDEQEVLPQILTLNKNTNILLSKMNGTKFKDNVLEQYKKLFEDGYLTTYSPSMIGNSLIYQNNDNTQKKSSQEENKNKKTTNDSILQSLPSHTSLVPLSVDKAKVNNGNKKITDIIEPESLKIVNRNIKKFLKDCKIEEGNKKIKIKKNQCELPSTSNIELKIEYENEEVKNRIEKMSQTDNDLLNSTEDILLELILKSQENQELKTKLISNCLNFDVNLAKRLAASLRMKGKDKEKSASLKNSEINHFEETKIKNKLINNKEDVEISVIDGEVIIKKELNENSDKCEVRDSYFKNFYEELS